MKRIAIITARGGSKRIPGKNIKSFCSRPIIEYSIEAAAGAGIFDEVMVSTDDDMIAEISRKAGAKVPFMRSSQNSGDFTSTVDVLNEVFDKYEEMDYTFDYACCIYPTAPFVTAEKLKKAMELLENEKGSMLMPVTRFSYPPQRGMIIENSRLSYKYPENYKIRSQDFEPIFHDCGQFYCYSVPEFKKAKGIITSGIIPYEILETEVQDIDNETDWIIAEMKYKLMKKLI